MNESAAYSQLLVYKASAGSGKTFTLAVQYIRLLIEDPYAYRRILAVTFTNKATAEMKNRILSQLYGIATRDKASEGYLREIRKGSDKTEEQIRKAANEALHAIIHDYSRFRIETIDSFFQSVMRNLARELEIGTNLSVELNADEALGEAVDGLIEKLDRHSPVLYWLLEYIDERIAGNERWDVSREIKNFGRNIFDEKYIERGETLRKKLADPQFIPHIRQRLQEARTEALERMKGFGEHFEEVLQRNDILPEELMRKGVVSNYFKKLAAGAMGDEVRNATIEKCLESADNWAAKSSRKRGQIRSLAEAELMDILREAEKLRPACNRTFVSCNLTLRHLNQLRLLTHINEEVHLQNRAHNRFLLADTNALLHSLMSEGDASFVYEKTGTTIDTVMIDEFQDTSRLQWENFHLLLEESLSHKTGSLIVGDIKQSIYRWRNGDWKILANLQHDPAFRIREVRLETNWRSEANIVQFNNDFFRTALQVLNQRYMAQHEGTPCLPLLDAYDDVEQKTTKKTERGYVQLSFLPDTSENPYKETVLRQVAQEVDNLVKAGIPTRDIAILTRKNQLITAIADYFDANTPYRVVSDEAFRLDASSAVCMLIDGLRHLAFPDNRISLARLAIAFQHDILHKEGITLNDILLGNTEEFLPAGFRMQRETLPLMPLYELLERLFELFDMQCIPDQDAYLCAFYDAVTDYLQNNSSELTAFLSFWEETLHAKNIPSGEIEGVRILSIHKSKGLEYHTILIPFCDWKMENETNNHLLWCEPNPEGDDLFSELQLVPVNYSAGMAQSVFHDSYAEEQLQLWIDNLNLLYVAFTRACKNLFVWGAKGKTGTVAELMQEVAGSMDRLCLISGTEEGFEEEEEDEKEEPVVYIDGELFITGEEKGVTPVTNRLLAHPEPRPIHIESLKCEIDFRQSNRSEEFIRGEDDDEGHDARHYIRQGLLLHHLFASIRTVDDLPEAVERLILEGVIESGEQEEEVRRIADRALKNPQAASWYDGSRRLYNECSILYTDAEGNLQTRRPDRVMVTEEETVVVDFKFGKPKEEYRKQVEEYMVLLKRMGYSRIKGYLWYVFDNRITEIESPKG